MQSFRSVSGLGRFVSVFSAVINELLLIGVGPSAPPANDQSSELTVLCRTNAARQSANKHQIMTSDAAAKTIACCACPHGDPHVDSHAENEKRPGQWIETEHLEFCSNPGTKRRKQLILENNGAKQQILRDFLSRFFPAAA